MRDSAWPGARTLAGLRWLGQGKQRPARAPEQMDIGLPKELVESLSPEVLKGGLDTSLGAMA